MSAYGRADQPTAERKQAGKRTNSSLYTKLFVMWLLLMISPEPFKLFTFELLLLTVGVDVLVTLVVSI